MQTRVQEVEDFVVAGLAIHETRVDDISEQWEELSEVLEDYEVNHNVLYGVCVNLTEDGINYLAGIKDDYMPSEVASEKVTIPAGKYLIGELQSIDDIEDAYRALNANQDYTHRPGISFEKYKGRNLENIEVWIPIE